VAKVRRVREAMRMEEEKRMLAKRVVVEDFRSERDLN